MSDEDVKKERDDNYNDALACWSPYYNEAYTDIKFFVGDPWSDSDKSFLKDENRNAYVFNKIRRVVKQVVGHQRRNRLSSVCQPIEGSDEKTAEIFTDLLLWVMQSTEGYHQLSEAFEGSVVSGMNLMSLWMDFREDPTNGDIRVGHEPYNSFLLDPYFTRLDLSDCRYIMRRRYVSPEEAKALLPDKVVDIDFLSPGKIDDKFTYMVYVRKNCDQDMLAYDEYWRRTHKEADLLIDNLTGESKTWKGSAAALKEFKNQFPWVKSKKIWVPSVELNIFVQNELMFSGEDPYGLGDYPFVPIVAMWEPQYDDYSYKLQGLIRSLRDPQEELNKRRSKGADILDSQVNSGWLITEGSVTNKADLYKTGQGVVIERAEGSLPTDVTKIQAPEIPQTLFSLIAELDKDIMEIAGVNEELLGVADTGNSEISGVLAKVRAANGLTTLQDLFDNLSLSQKLMGKKIIKMIQENWGPEKIERITAKQPTEEFYDKQFGKFDCVVKEAMLTDTQRQLAYAQALAARQVGIAVPDSFIIEMMPIANKEELKESFEAQAQQQAQQQQHAMEQEQMIRDMQKAQIIQGLSLAGERKARIQSDLALATERISESEQNRSQAALDRAKTISEIASMEDERIIRVLEFVNNLQAQEIVDREAIAGKVSAQAGEIENTLLSQLKEQPSSSQPQAGLEQQLVGGGV